MLNMLGHNIAIQDAEKWVARGPLPSLHSATEGADHLHLLIYRMSHGLEDYETHARPDGPAPDGKTWSFALGKWQDEDYLRSAKKAKYNDA